MGATAIEVRGLSKRFGETTALDDVDLVVEPGRILGLLGPNGAGKTTLVRVLATLIRPDSGTASVGGHDVVNDAHRARRLIGLTGQYAAVDGELSGRQNLVLVARLLGLSRRDARARAAELLTDAGLTEAADRSAKTYSGGMRRRLDLAAGLVSRPEVVFLDEPTTGLDPARRADTWDTVRALADRGSTVLLTTQYLEEADRLADDIAVLDAGRVIARGSADSLKRRLGTQTLSLRVVDAARLGDAAARAGGVLRSEPVTDRAGRRLTAPVPDPAAMPAVVRALDDAGIAVDELELRLPSLDDVFLTLTGHRADPSPASAATAETPTTSRSTS